MVSKGDLLQVIVAEDLFRALVNDPKQLLLRATYKAARAWAGQEEVARGLMMNFLFDACPAAHYFIQARAVMQLPPFTLARATCDLHPNTTEETCCYMAAVTVRWWIS